jgi:uncharacterized protein (UPF0332 family)
MAMSDSRILVLLTKGLIGKASANTEEIIALIQSAEQGLREARLVIADDPVRSVSQMYDALYDACRAFMLSQGYRATVKDDYIAVLRFCEAYLERKEIETLKAFDATERRRHDEMYDGCFSLTSEDAAAMFTRARKFVARIKTALAISK